MSGCGFLCDKWVMYSVLFLRVIYQLQTSTAATFLDFFNRNTGVESEMTCESSSWSFTVCAVPCINVICLSAPNGHWTHWSRINGPGFWCCKGANYKCNTILAWHQAGGKHFHGAIMDLFIDALICITIVLLAYMNKIAALALRSWGYDLSTLKFDTRKRFRTRSPAGPEIRRKIMMNYIIMTINMYIYVYIYIHKYIYILLYFIWFIHVA